MRRATIHRGESAEIWDRWQRGEGLKLIGRVLGKHSSSIFAHLRPHGGIRPAPRRRSRRVLSLAEREEISRGRAGSLAALDRGSARAGCVDAEQRNDGLGPIETEIRPLYMQYIIGRGLGTIGDSDARSYVERRIKSNYCDQAGPFICGQLMQSDIQAEGARPF